MNAVVGLVGCVAGIIVCVVDAIVGLVGCVVDNVDGDCSSQEPRFKLNRSYMY